MKGKISRERLYLYQINGKNRARPLLVSGAGRAASLLQAGEGKDRPTPGVLDQCSPPGTGKSGFTPSYTRLTKGLLAGRLVSDQPEAPVPSGLVI